MALINVPFEGFYNSRLSDLIDHELTRELEHLEEKYRDWEYSYPDESLPDELQPDLSDLWQAVDYGAAYLEIARDWVEAFALTLDQWAIERDNGAPKSGLTFSRMDSPREYNFRTDEIDCEIDAGFAHWLWAQSVMDDHRRLRLAMERRHKSRDGFISAYSWRLDEWSESVDDWDYHQLRTLLESVFADEFESDEYSWGIYYTLAEGAYIYLDKHLNWDEVESQIKESVTENLDRWIEESPDEVRDWAANNGAKFARYASDAAFAWEGGADIAYRCEFTGDLFGGMEV